MRLATGDGNSQLERFIWEEWEELDAEIEAALENDDCSPSALMGSLCAALSANPRAQCTYLCEVVIWAWAIGSWMLKTPAPPRAVSVPKAWRSWPLRHRNPGGVGVRAGVVGEAGLVGGH
jgi:hypothetical protein